MGEDGTPLPPGSRGEIVARSRLVFNGYHGNAEATEEVSQHGWHHTGDVGYKDEAGFVYIVAVLQLKPGQTVAVEELRDAASAAWWCGGPQDCRVLG